MYRCRGSRRDVLPNPLPSFRTHLLPSTALEFLQAELELQEAALLYILSGICVLFVYLFIFSELLLILLRVAMLFWNKEGREELLVVLLSHIQILRVTMRSLTQLCHHLDYEIDLVDVKCWSWHNEVNLLLVMEVEFMVLKLLLLNLMRRLISIGHGFVVGDEGYRQDSDIQKVKLSREALTQLSKLVESRVSTGLDTILTLFYSFWNWGCCQVRLNTIYHKSSVCISRGCGWQHLGPFINLGAFYLCGISLAATFAFWVKLRASIYTNPGWKNTFVFSCINF
ncbi:uncharacterized protein LOC107638910 isoform X4 [Arachis ipaensis]|uniref:uncharacterized protein LOC107638910 isoform X4 n=1 Tax=Arachis ipaensis TaxID=130454 RepID=UPI000A2B29AC|nr:uncharacterized protein LOC107638910 isoform X4 [Arachis ipaensis]XP_020976426.1 uncharacterized protein LOC107638910 isoform X4 [Arachis ipaensis]